MKVACVPAVFFYKPGKPSENVSGDEEEEYSSDNGSEDEEDESSHYSSEDGEDDRVFYSENYGIRKHFTLQQATRNVKVPGGKPSVQIYHPQLRRALKHTKVISVDGACRGNGRAHARAAYGIYYGRDARNSYGCLPYSFPQTNQVAELYAVNMALDYFQVYDRHVEAIIATDSDYVFKGLTQYIYKWRENDYTNARGFEVVNADMFRDIDAAIDEKWSKFDLRVKFWKIPRDENFEADELANLALDED